jgi:hypothetical protein
MKDVTAYIQQPLVTALMNLSSLIIGTEEFHMVVLASVCPFTTNIGRFDFE